MAKIVQTVDGEAELALSAGSMSQYLREEFAATKVIADLADKWDIRSVGAGASASIIAGGSLRLSSGATAGDEIEIISKQAFTLPCRALVHIIISQRVANQEITVDLIDADSAGVVDAAGKDRASWIYDGTTTTSAKVQTWADGDTIGSQNQAGMNSSAAANIVEIDATPDECWFFSSSPDTTTTKSTSNRLQRRIPQPHKFYKLRIRVKNTGAASNTTVDIDGVILEDYTQSVTEVNRSRGSGAGAESLMVFLMNSPVVYDRMYGVRIDESTTNLAASATFTGAARDLHGSGSSAQIAGIGANRFAVASVSDVVGDLYIEVSHDNTNWRRIAKQTATQPAGAGQAFYAELEVKALFRYARAVYINGAGAQTYFALMSVTKGVI